MDGSYPRNWIRQLELRFIFRSFVDSFQLRQAQLATILTL